MFICIQLNSLIVVPLQLQVTSYFLQQIINYKVKKKKKSQS